MITWIQRFFFKHNKVLFGSLLVVIVVTFVLTIGPQSFFDGNSGPEQRELPYFGYDLASPADQQRLFAHAELSAMLNPELGLQQDQLADYAYIRAAGLGLARQMNLPNPSSTELEAFVRSRTIFQDRETGEFSTEMYNQIVGFLEASDRFDRKGLARVLEEDYQVEAVRALLSGPLYLLPKEIEAAYVTTKSTYEVGLARRSFEGFETDLEIGEAEALAYYEENPARYEIPERLKATAVRFINRNFLNSVAEPSEAELENYFNRNQSRYQPAPEVDENGDPVEKEAIVLADVRDQVVADVKLESAKRVAEQRSEAFTVALWEREIARDSEAFDALVAEFGGSLESIPPYSAMAAPTLPYASRQILNSLWTYTTGRRYFSEVNPNREGASVVVVDEVIPAEIPPFESIQDQVVADLREEERVRLFIEEGPILKEELTSAIAEGESLEAVVSGLELEWQALDAFTGENVPTELRRNNLWQEARYLNDGEVSDMVFTGEAGVFVIADKITSVEVNRSSDEYKAFVEEQTGSGSLGLGWSRLSELSSNALEGLGLGE